MSYLRFTGPFVILFTIFIIHNTFCLPPCPLHKHFPQFYIWSRSHVSGYFGKRTFFSAFEKSFSPVQTETLKQWKNESIPYRACAVWCMTSSYSKTSVFFRPHQKDKPAGPLYSGDHFHEPAFLVPETTFNVWTEGLSVFENIKDPKLFDSCLSICLFSQKNTVRMIVGCINSTLLGQPQK